MAFQTGILLKAIAGFYYVEAGDSIFECKARGLFRKNHESPAVGDRLSIEVFENKKGLVCEILPRKNILVRPAIANLDQLIIVSAHNTPTPNALTIDRLTAIAVDNNITPVIVFNKTDLGEMDDWYLLYKQAGFQTVLASGLSGEGCDEIRAMLKDKVSAFTGNSGVGKSSLLNQILPELHLQTGAVSEKLGRGRHTTRHVELFPAFGGYVADTPGFSSLDIEKTMPVDKEDLQYTFLDFAPYIGKCQFSSCTHRVEKGCAVLQAVHDGKISKSRQQSYTAIYNEVKDIKAWEK